VPAASGNMELVLQGQHVMPGHESVCAASGLHSVGGMVWYGMAWHGMVWDGMHRKVRTCSATAADIEERKGLRVDHVSSAWHALLMAP
jgi:hypothetical protein